MDTVIFKKWLEDNEILDKATKLFWTHFNEHLCTDWASELRLLAPIKEDCISLDYHEACLKIEDISTLRKTNPSEYVEVRLNVFFKGSFFAHFNIQFDFFGKWVSYETNWNSLSRLMCEDIVALESLKEMFEKDITIEEYGLETTRAVINMIDRKIRTIKGAFE
jgi:hypothetical protein